MRWLALLAVALHVFTIEGHVHIAPFSGGHAIAAQPESGVAAPTGAQAGKQLLSSPISQSPCIFCQTMAAAGSGIAPNAPLLAIWLGAAALVAALFGQRQVALQRLTIWRSRAPPHRL